MSVKVVYTTKATATGGRTGSAKSEDGQLDVTLTTPKEMGGAGGDGTNPEQMFAAGYSACFIGAMKAVAAQDKSVKVPDDVSVTATVGIGPRSEGGFGLEVALAVNLPNVDRAAAQALIEKAHQVCPYSNATRNNIDVKLSLA